MDERPVTRSPGISDGFRRMVDQRGEHRVVTESQTAVLNHRGHRHVVRVADLSASGAMIVFQGDLAEGDQIMLQLLDQGAVTGQVRWVRDGRAGVSFAVPGGSPTDG